MHLTENLIGRYKDISGLSVVIYSHNNVLIPCKYKRKNVSLLQ